MFIKVHKSIIDNERFIRNRMAFPTISYIMITHTARETSYLTIGSVLEYFKIPRTKRNVDSVKECINILISEGFFNVIFGEASTTNINSLIGLSCNVSSNNKYNQIEISELDDIISIYNDVGDYLFANVFLVIRKSSYSNILSDRVIDTANISHASILKASSIGSKTTITKYIKLLEDANIFSVCRTVVLEGENAFRSKNIYTFRERLK